MFVFFIIGTLYFCAECCLELLADGIPYVCCSVASALGLCYSRLESRIPGLLLILSSEFSLSNSRLECV